MAQLIEVNPGELSQIFNEYLHTLFYEYVNKYRVEEFSRLLQTPDADKLTLIALSEQCGFSSKSTFYRAFINEKGMTHAQYAKLKKMTRNEKRPINMQCFCTYQSNVLS